jgi:hypothetical protein
VVPALRGLAAAVAGLGGVERIFINLERRTPPAFFARFGSRLVPTFNYFQTALVLAADGWLDAEDVAGVASGLVERSAYTPRRLENSLADLVRRGVVAAQASHALTAPMRAAGLLPALPRRAWLTRLRARLGRRAPAPMRRSQTGALDYDEILARVRPAAPEAGAR